MGTRLMSTYFTSTRSRQSFLYNPNQNSNLTKQTHDDAVRSHYWPDTLTKMPSSAAAGTAYTTIPISGLDVISRSTQNLSASLSRRRPWPEFLASISSLDIPPSLSAAFTRLQRNSAYFSVNYAIIVTVCAAISLITSPTALIMIGLVFYLWLILHFFREDPLLIWGHHVNDWGVIGFLIVLTVLALWITGPLNSLSIGISVGLLISIVHGVFRNPEGLFLDENDAASTGLIVSHGGGTPINPPL